MDHFAGLDVSVKETSICIVDDTGTTEISKLGADVGLEEESSFCHPAPGFLSQEFDLFV